MTQQCAACGSNELLRRTRLVKHGVAAGEVSVDVPIPGFSGFGGFRSGLRAVTCVACGHVQIHATDLADLRRAYEERVVNENYQAWFPLPPLQA